MALTKITSNVLADEFTTIEAMSANDVDFTSAKVFTKTLSVDTTLTF